MDLIDREQALGCFWNYANDDGTGYDETDMPAYDRLQALPIVKEVDDCISRQAAIDGIEQFRPIEPKRGETSMEAVNRSAWDCAINCVETFIRTMPPSAQPERMRGKWIDEGFYADGHGAHAFRCSECGGHIIEYDVDPFCRWCGANMRGGQDEQE